MKIYLIVEDWVLVKYDGLTFIGIILEVKDDEYKVQTMHNTGTNAFKWPRCDDICWYNVQITGIIDPQSPINNRGLYKLTPEDFNSYKIQ